MNIVFGPTVILVIITEDLQRHHPDRHHIIVQLEIHNKVWTFSVFYYFFNLFYVLLTNSCHFVMFLKCYHGHRLQLHQLVIQHIHRQ